MTCELQGESIPTLLVWCEGEEKHALQEVSLDRKASSCSKILIVDHLLTFVTLLLIDTAGQCIDYHSLDRHVLIHVQEYQAHVGCFP